MQCPRRIFKLPYRQPLTILGLLAALCLTQLPAIAQSVQGSILGTVRDAAGAVVPGAAVTLTNTDDGTVRTTTTNATGTYQFLDAEAGHYVVEIAAKGFKRWTTSAMTLAARQEMRVDAKLAVGSIQQTVQVSGDNAGAIDTETPQISATLGSHEILSLPMNFRASSGGTSALALAAVLPNVDYAQPSSVWTSVTLAGSLTAQTMFDVDGVSIMATSGNHPDGDLLPSADDIAEVRGDGVLTDAEHSSPGEITFISKGGTNQLHGGLWWYHQDSSLNATPYGAVTKPHIVGNTFGFRLSGPVVIPRVYNGHNKTFFWFDYEGYRFPEYSPEQYTVPTPAMLQGDFTNFDIPDQNGNNTFQGLVNPATGKVCGYTFAACGFQINSAAQQFLKFFPKPNHAATVNLGNGSTMNVDTSHFVAGESANYWVNKDTSLQSDEYDARIDQYFGSNQKFLLWGRLVWKDFPSNDPQTMLFPDSTTIDQSRNAVISANYTITPSMINEFRFGYALFNYGHRNSFDGTGFTQGLGLKGLQNLWFNGVPYLSLGSGTGISSFDPGRLNNTYGNTVYLYSDTLSWTKGQHDFKFGGGAQWQQNIEPGSIDNPDQYGNFYFGNGTQFTGLGWSDFLLGIPGETYYDVIPSDSNFVTTMWDFFGQDQWRVTPRLTLSYGLRYEFNPGFYDANGLMGNFDTSVPLTGRFIYPDGKQQYLNQAWLAGANACDPDGVNNTNSSTVNGVGCTPVVTNSQAGLPAGLRPSTKDRIMPRLGFAYRLNNNATWVIRGGYGIYNNYISADSVNSGMGLMLQSGLTSYNNGYQGGGTSGTPIYQWPVIYAGAGTAQNSASPGQANVGSVDVIHGWVDPYTEQWTLSLGHDFGAGYGARLSYIGSVSRHLEWNPDANALPFSNTTPAYNQPNSARLFPNMGRVSILDTGANMNYNALQLDVSHRFLRGLEFDSTFTWAKDLADNQGADGCAAEETGGCGATSIYDRHLDYGNVQGPHRLAWKTSEIYYLPIGRGQMFGSNMPGALDALVGGWALSNILEWDSGMYFTPTVGTGGDPSGTGSGICSSAAGWNPTCVDQHPDVVSGQSLKAQHQTPEQWLNPQAFTCPGDPNWKPGYGCYTGNAPGNTAAYDGQKYVGQELINGALYPIPGPIGRFGNASVGSLLGPGYIDLNSGLAKTFSLTERFKLRVEGTFTNVLNHTNYDGTSMNTNVTSRSYGYISGALPARNGQVSVRLDF